MSVDYGTLAEQTIEMEQTTVMKRKYPYRTYYIVIKHQSIYTIWKPLSYLLNFLFFFIRHKKKKHLKIERSRVYFRLNQNKQA